MFENLWVWIQANPVQAALVAFVVSRVIVKYTPSDVDNKFLDMLVEIAKMFGVVIPTDEKEVAKVVDKVVDKLQLPSALPDGFASDLLAGRFLGTRFDDRPMIRRRIRRIAARNSLDISELGDAEIDDAIWRLNASAGGSAMPRGGLLANLLAWISNHPDAVMAVLKTILELLAKNEDLGDPGAVS